MHYGIISPPVSGHIHPFGALGRELIARGHRVTMLQMEDVRSRAEEEGIEFAALGQTDHPAGSLDASLARLGALNGFAALRFTIEAVCRTTEMICRDAPDAIRARGIDCLLVDQTEPAGGSVADRLGIPFVTVCNALMLNREPAVPPPFTGWDYRPNAWRRARNSCGYAVYDKIQAPVMKILNRWRERWHLPAHRGQNDTFSSLAQISQMPRGFDFPRLELPGQFVYVGPLRGMAPHPVSFPWEKLDGRPVIFASLGTLQYTKRAIFRVFAEACAPLNVQLVMAHCGGLDAAAIQAMPGQPLAVHYAPQREVLKRACLTLTHAGLNTVLDSLAQATPMIAIPITYEQPAIAARVRASGAGWSLAPSQLTAARLRMGIERILGDTSFAERAQCAAREIGESGGVRKAADIIEACK